MVRKRKEDVEITLGLLLDAAEEVFSRRGYAQATFQEIAEQAGLTRGAIYWHFKDKEALLDAVLHRAPLPWDQLPAHFNGLRQAPTVKQLSMTLGAGLQQIVSDPRLHRTTLILLHRTELVHENYLVYCRLTRILNRIKTYVVAALSMRFKEADGSPCKQIPAIATSVKTLLTGSIYEWLLNQAEVDLKHIPSMIEALCSPLMGKHQTSFRSACLSTESVVV
ncbi:TetR family transcriptional regulator [Pseudomonas nunensis]|uniref:TetR family transcriptional regulator n=1 Tax=Pseudomonas nunensis TaxID=2961896 RepID=A0ABY5EGA3_9PSED|nr:TetR family transcriptional regulator [Pseudomonas nunensis]MCL5227182.1 TetR family transcriptional regulator [Pseudomonas nunensis]UTO14579.1 TetR family transcriptional regulator [Pseudomonas nunensis]